MNPEDVRPLTPAEVLDIQKNQGVYIRATVIHGINKLLEMGIYNFDGPSDNDSAAYWVRHHTEIIEEYRTAGWEIKPSSVVYGYVFTEPKRGTDG
jgi:hypothetical protein